MATNNNKNNTDTMTTPNKITADQAYLEDHNPSALTRLHTVTFSPAVQYTIPAISDSTGADLENVTVEIGLYDRSAYRGTIVQWDLVAAELAQQVESATKPSWRRSLKAALGRIRTSAADARYLRDRAARRDARRDA